MKLKNTILTLLLTLIICLNNYAQKIVVCESCEITSISEAIKKAKDFDTILVKKGTYKEYNISIDKPLTLIGENYPLIDGEDQGEIITITSDNVTFDGFYIFNGDGHGNPPLTRFVIAAVGIRCLPTLAAVSALMFLQSNNPHKLGDDPSNFVGLIGKLLKEWRARPFPASNNFPTKKA